MSNKYWASEYLQTKVAWAPLIPMAIRALPSIARAVAPSLISAGASKVTDAFSKPKETPAPKQPGGLA